MNFRDELNKKIKPMKNEYDETRVEIEKEARRLYSSIKEILLLKAETGNYIYKHNMRYVSFYQFLSSRIEKYITITYSPSVKVGTFIQSEYKRMNDERFIINPQYYNEYMELMNLLEKLCEKDRIRITPVIRNKYTKEEYAFPSPVLGVDVSDCYFALKCSVYC